LEGTDYQFTFRFGERRGGWVFDLATLDGVAILTGQLVTIGTDLLRRAAMPERPPGKLTAWSVVRDSQSFRKLPGLYDLGPSGRCQLYYTESTTAAENTADGITFEDGL
jgi:hypothetical protein